ncbi:hypothetical protein CGC20_11015 [Leishmania donovani]|uniref:Uncharacterized protein n=1 Tax=Leishmania donovani TaxID=5661 RepID=A0A504Y645_LEIDO|nr:hypothetical protein CGC20_11015 [Leishmania donovani]
MPYLANSRASDAVSSASSSVRQEANSVTHLSPAAKGPAMAARCLTRFLDTVTVIEQIERTSDALLPLHRHRRLQHSEIQSAEESNGGYVNLVSRLLNEQGMCPSVAMQSLPMRALWRQMLGLSNCGIEGYELMRGQNLGYGTPRLGRCFGRVFFSTADLVQHREGKNVVKVFTYVASAWGGALLALRSAQRKQRFMNCPEAHLPGDLHSVSFFADAHQVKRHFKEAAVVEGDALQVAVYFLIDYVISYALLC